MSDSCQDLPNIKQNYNWVDIFREKNPDGLKSAPEIAI